MLSLSWKSASSFHKPKTIIKPRVITRAVSPVDWNTISYFTGKGILIFTFSYCTLNWLTLKKWREDQDEDKSE